MNQEKNSFFARLLYKKFPSGDLIFFVCLPLFFVSLILFAYYRYQILIRIAAASFLMAFFYASVWLGLYNHITSRKLRRMANSFPEEKEKIKI